MLFCIYDALMSINFILFKLWVRIPNVISIFLDREQIQMKELDFTRFFDQWEVTGTHSLREILMELILSLNDAQYELN